MKPHLQLIFIFFIVYSPFSLFSQEKLNIRAKSAILIDNKTGFIIYEKDPDTKAYPASITKIMTALIAVKEGKLTDSIKVSRKAAWGIEPGSSTISLKPNEIVTLKDVLYGLMIRSANECGNIIAEYISGSNAQFAELMNKTAKEIGCTGSNFTNPHGLHNENHYVTAKDMALISQYALTFEGFRKIVKTRFYPFPDTNKHKHEERGNLRNKNKMLHPKNKEYVKECIGIKNGYTTKALHTFSAAAQKNDNTVIAVILRANSKKDMYQDLKKMLMHGLNSFSERTLCDTDFPVKEIKIKNANSLISLTTKDIVKTSLPTNLKQSLIVKKTDIPMNITLPVRKGDILGTLAFYYNDKKLGETPLKAANDVDNIYSWNNLRKYVLTPWFLILFAVICSVIILMIPVPFQKKKNSYYR